MTIDWLWRRYDLCAAVNRRVNGAHRHEAVAAIAAAKVRELQAEGVPATDVSVCEISTDEGRTFNIVAVVEDRLGRWVLMPTSDYPEWLQKKSAIVRTAEGRTL